MWFTKPFSQMERITRDSWILKSIMGYSIEFESKPFQRKVPTQINFNKEQFEIIENEVCLKKQLVFHIMNQDNLFQTYLLLKRRTVNTDLSLTSKN